MAAMSTKDVWLSNLKEAHETVAKLYGNPDLMDKCAKFSELLIATFRRDGKVLACGNGGSHCDAMHFSEEFSGRYYKNRRPLGALALGDPSHLTCTANDFGFEYVFSRQVEALGRPGDLFLGISTSGNSQNVINALEAARARDMKTVCLLGKDGGKLKELADLAIVVPAMTPHRIQELHIKIIHIAVESTERDLFPEHYAQ